VGSDKTPVMTFSFSAQGSVADLEGPGWVWLQTMLMPGPAHALFAETGGLRRSTLDARLGSEDLPSFCESIRSLWQSAIGIARGCHFAPLKE
jgi:hypothetical protein